MAAGNRGDVAVCEGGPWDRWAFYVDDLDARRSAALAIGATFPYRPTKRLTEHRIPKAGKVEAVVWEHAPPPPEDTLPPEPPAPLPPPVIRYSEDLDPVDCPTCGDSVIRVRRPRGDLVLDLGVARGGLWRFDDRGRPVRRPITETYSEERGEDHGGGYVVHECHQAAGDPRAGPD